MLSLLWRRREFLDVVVRERVQELNLESKLALATNLSPKSANDRAVYVARIRFRLVCRLYRAA